MRIPYISLKGWVLLLFVLPVTLGTLVACNNNTDLTMEEIKKCEYDTTFYDYFSRQEHHGKRHYVAYYTVNLDRYNCGEKGNYTLKSVSRRADPYDNRLGQIVDVEFTRQQILEKLEERKYDSLRGVAYDSMIKGQANGKTGYYLFMKNTFKGTGIPMNLEQGVDSGTR